MLGWLCKIKYIAYFYDKTIFDTSPQNGEGTVDFYIGDIVWPEGVWKGMQDMRKGEKSKIRIQKKHAFGRLGEVDKLRWPKGYSTSEADAERHAKITSKAVIYEVTMIDWIERMDMEANGLMYKQVIQKATRKEYELPNEEFDEVTFNMKVWQSPTDSLFDVVMQPDESEEQKTEVDNRVLLIEREATFLSMDSVKCLALRKALHCMKRNENCRFTVNPEFLEENEDEGMEEFFAGTQWDKTKPFVMDMQLTKLVKVEDWYKDKTTVMRTYRKGKGRSAYTDS